MVAAHCADSADAAAACYSAMSLVEDALAQLTDELTACATWRDARVEFLKDLRKENHGKCRTQPGVACGLWRHFSQIACDYSVQDPLGAHRSNRD